MATRRKRLQRPRATRKPQYRVDWMKIVKGCITASKIAGIPSNVGRSDTIPEIR